jgi:hypothetical protein
MRAALIAMIFIIGVTACSGNEGTGVVSAEGDATRLQELLGSDPARTLLQEIEQAVDSERPVMAADMIEQAALPAIRRQIQRLEEASITTQEGRRLRTRAVRIHRERADVLARYGRALARGIGTEDDELLDAMRAYAAAELELVSLYRELEQLHPLRPERGDSADDNGSSDDGASLGPVEPRAGEPQEPLPEL